MVYSDIFMRQWKSFCKDFSINIQKRRDAGLGSKKLDEWYQLNILRWESSVETEGVVLEQQNSKELKERLLGKLKSFRFKEVSPLTDQKAIVPGCMLVIVTLLLAILECIWFPVSTIWKIILAIVIIAVAVMEALKGIQKAKEKVQADRREQYKEQLNAYGEELIMLCKTYNSTK